MSYIVGFVVVLVISMIDSSQAVTCYQCNYTSTQNESMCGTPVKSESNETCSGSVCSWQLTNYTSPTSYVAINRDCTEPSGNTTGDFCPPNPYNYTTFKHGDSCCYSTGPMVDGSGESYSMTTCWCQNDNCNGDIPETVGPPSKPSDMTSAASKDIISMLKTFLWAMMTCVVSTAMVATIG